MKSLWQQLSARASAAAFWLVLLGWLATFAVGHRWQDPQKVIDQDVIGYYSYVPAVFVYHDIGMWYVVKNGWFRDKVWAELYQGGLLQKYTMGMAVFYTPFFALGHFTAWIAGAEMNGYSWPYAFWLQFSGLFYAALGLGLLRRLLRMFIAEIPAALTLLGIGLGTNLFYYAAIQAPMAHAVEFFLLTAWLLLIAGFWRQPGAGRALLVGLCGGLIVLVRPSHLVLWVLPVLYGVASWGELKDRAGFLLRRAWLPLLVLGMAGLCVFPQFLYWKHITGGWFFWSYKEERFYWDAPLLLQNWFSFRNGWLIYTPMMALALAGLVPLLQRWRELRWVLPLCLGIAAWVISAWWCWWYGGSFGNRPWVDFYGWLGMGLGALLAWAWGRGGLWGYVLGGITGLFICLNIFQSWQMSRDILHYDAMTAAAWKAQLFCVTPDSAALAPLLDPPDYSAARAGDR